MKKLFLISAFFILGKFIYCQSMHYCWTDEDSQKKRTENSIYQATYDSASKVINFDFQNSRNIINVPVVFHLVISSQAATLPEQAYYDAVQVLNENFRRQNADAQYTGVYGGGYNINQFGQLSWFTIPYGGVDMEINFSFSNYTLDIVPSLPLVDASNYEQIKYSFNHSEYSPQNYLKVWIVPMVDGGLEGVSTFPWDFPANPTMDGIVLDYSDIGYSTPQYYDCLTHEVGHWVGLRHIWGDSFCGDDYVIDTYPQPNESINMGQSCNYFLVQCPNFNNGYEYAHMFDNYMDYSSSSCMNFFSQGQKERAHYYLQTFRTSIATNIIEKQSNNKLYCYKSSDDIFIFKDGNILTKISIYSIDGKLNRIITGQELQNTNINLNSSSLMPGIYIVVCEGKEMNHTLKIIKN